MQELSFIKVNINLPSNGVLGQIFSKFTFLSLPLKNFNQKEQLIEIEKYLYNNLKY